MSIDIKATAICDICEKTETLSGDPSLPSDWRKVGLATITGETWSYKTYYDICDECYGSHKPANEVDQIHHNLFVKAWKKLTQNV